MFLDSLSRDWGRICPFGAAWPLLREVGSGRLLSQSTVIYGDTMQIYERFIMTFVCSSNWTVHS